MKDIQGLEKKNINKISLNQDTDACRHQNSELPKHLIRDKISLTLDQGTHMQNGKTCYTLCIEIQHLLVFCLGH